MARTRALRSAGRWAAGWWGAVALLLLAGCTSGASPVPTPLTGATEVPISSGSQVAPGSTTSTAASTSTTTSAPSGATTDPSSGTDQDSAALDACDDLGIMPCARQVARISLPIAGTSIRLTYSSDRTAGRDQDRAPSATGIGLGGWTLSVLDSFDTAGRTVISGDGDLRPVQGLSAAGRIAVANRAGTGVDVFDSTGRAVSVLDAITGTPLLTFAWGPHGLTSVADRAGTALKVVRLPDGTPVRLDVPNGPSTQLGTRHGLIAVVQYPDHSRALMSTDPSGLIRGWSSTTGRYVGYGFDKHGRLVSQQVGSADITRYIRAVSGNTMNLTTTTPGGLKTVDSVAITGSVKTWTHTDPSGITSSVSAAGRQRNLASADGTTSSITLAPDPRWGFDAPFPATMTIDRLAVTAKSAAGNSADPWRATSVTSSMTVDGHTWTFVYDPTARTTTRTDPTGASTTAAFDTSGRAIRTMTGGVPVSYTYGSAGRLASVSEGTGTDARTWTYAYTGHTVTITDPIGGVQRRDLSATGALTRVAGAGGAGLTVTRDSGDRIIGFAAPGGGTYQVTWGVNGRVASVNAPAGQGGPQFLGYQYNRDGDLIRRFTSDTRLTLSRDTGGRVNGYDAGAGQVTVSYDAAGRLSGVTDQGDTVTETYSGTAVTDEKVTGTVATQVSRTLDSAGRTATLTPAGGTAIDYGYDGAGRVSKAGGLVLERDPTTGLVTAEILGVLRATFSYNQFGQTIGEQVTNGQGAVLTSVGYGRDKLGRVVRTVRQTGGHTSRTQFTYDAAGRLTTESTDGATTSYQFDAAGNLVAITDPKGVVTKLTYDGRNALIQRGDTHYTYDGAGQLATASSSAGTTGYHYDGAGRLLSVQPPGGDKISYTVDGFGRRVATSVAGKVVAGVAYLDSLRPAADLDSSGQISKQYVYAENSTTPSYLISAGTAYLEVADPSGGPTSVIDSRTGAIADSVTRTALGVVTSETAPGFQSIGFAGGIADAANSLVHFGARDYDPAAGRWTAPDPLLVGGGSANLYEYVGGDPVNRQDPAGRLCDYFGVSLDYGIALGGGAVGSVGFGTAGDQLGVFGSYGAQGGSGASVQVVFTCLDKYDHSTTPTLNDFGGKGTAEDASYGAAGGGANQGYGSDGALTSRGGHVGLGPSFGFGKGGTSASGTDTTFFCLAGCPDDREPFQYPPSNDDHNPNADGVPDCPGGTCNSDPADGGGAPPPPADICDAGVCSDPSDAPTDPTVPSGNGPRSTGDPHLTTADGVGLNFQAVGEFTWLKSDSGDLVVQVRQRPAARGRIVSVTSDVALSISGDRIQVSNPPVNSQPLSMVLAGATVPSVGTFTLPHGASVVRNESAIAIVLRDGTKLWLRANPRGLNVNALLSATRKGGVHGLVGPFTGRSPATAETRSGTQITNDQLKDYNTLYRTFGDSWRITQAESLFVDLPGKDSSAFDDPTFPDRKPSPIPPSALAAAKVVCGQMNLPPEALSGCVEDVARTGDAGFAATTASATGSVPGAPATRPNAAGGIAPGQSVSGNVAAGGKNLYTVTVQAGTVAYFAAAPDCKRPTSGDIFVSVLDTAGQDFRTPAEICNDLGRVVFTSGGTYQLLVASFNGGAGAYTLTWQTSRPDLRKQLSVGATASGTIDAPGAHDVWTFTVPAGTVAYFAATPGCKRPAGGDIYISILDDAGRDFRTPTEICNDLGRVVFTTGGSYQLLIAGIDGATSPYAVLFQQSRTDIVRSLTPGAAATGTLEVPGAHDLWTFTVAAGTAATFAAAPGCKRPADGDIYVSIVDSNGQLFRSATEICNDLGQVAFTSAGSYQLLVASIEGGTGAYTVTWK